MGMSPSFRIMRLCRSLEVLELTLPKFHRYWGIGIPRYPPGPSIDYQNPKSTASNSYINQSTASQRRVFFSRIMWLPVIAPAANGLNRETLEGIVFCQREEYNLGSCIGHSLVVMVDPRNLPSGKGELARSRKSQNQQLVYPW